MPALGANQVACAGHRVFIGLGANLGDAPRTLQQALDAMAHLPQTTWCATSSLYRTAPLEAEGPDFFNAVAELHTQLRPLALLDALQRIEQQHGRERPYANAPRTLDLDLLLYGKRIIAGRRLTVPHPRLSSRAFVLVPLNELDDELHIPGQGRLARLLHQVADQRIECLGTVLARPRRTRPRS
jgi:2-amino-4-hydroxy-6-hydroxymethyldihydropteridine diphosphokinase